MLTFWGSNSGKLCDGYSRRSFLQAGALAVGGLTLEHFVRARAYGAAKTSSKATKATMIDRAIRFIAFPPSVVVAVAPVLL